MNLTDPGTLRDLLQRHGLWARKGLGQHFLISPSAVRAIAASVADCAGVLEIGPGPGVLTSALSAQATVIAVEVDEPMSAVLRESAPKAELVLGDALEVGLEALLAKLPEPRAVVSNLPYYITGPLITRIAGARKHYTRAVLMMQKEVATRIKAEAGSSDRGSLSVFLQSLFEIKRVAQVPAGAFLPPPKVDSTVLAFEPRVSNDPDEFFVFVRGGFSQPRKTLTNNLMTSQGVSREVSAIALEQLGLDPRARAQDLTVEQWRGLYSALHEHLAGNRRKD